MGAFQGLVQEVPVKDWTQVQGHHKNTRSLPVDFTAIKKMFLRRVVFLVRKYSIPPSLFLNIDETGVNLLPCQKHTWGPSGAQQISVLGWGDKRQFTCNHCRGKVGR